MMAKVIATREVDAPEGPVCANWGYRTWMPSEQNFRCDALRDETVHISASDASASGLGHSAGNITRMWCSLFDADLSYEYGVGPFKCRQCAYHPTQEADK